jgi:dienelactone hydrolase
MRGYGCSDGQANAFGWGAAADVRAAVTWLRSRTDVRGGRIAGLGLSVGAEQLLEAAASDRRLRALVADGAGERSVRETVHRGVAAAAVLPQQAVQTLAVAALTGSAPPPALDDLLGRLSPRPVLFIQAGRGSGGEDRDAVYARLAGPGSRLWRVPAASHTRAIAVRPAAYARRVIGFLDAALRPGASAPPTR